MKNKYGFGDNAPGNNSVSNINSAQLKDIKKTLPLKKLTQEQFEFWQNNGYLVLRQIISPEEVKRSQDFLWEFQEMDPNDSSTWYQAQRRDHAMVELNNSGMVECYNNQVLWDNRQNPEVYNAFVDIWDQESLWVTIDRANLNPPNKTGREFSGFVHWDADSSLDPLPVNVQGVLALSDTNEETGGFQCVPELYRQLEEWRKTQPADRDPYVPDLTGFEVEFISMRAGDLLIFNSLLPHGIRPNQSDTVRMAQYISMVPAEEDNQLIRDWRIRSWQDRLPPEGYAFPGDPRNWEQVKYPRAELTPLGKKLLGLESWKVTESA
ncbi:phytanoyl-CoA dioxygenase family protein [Vibrio parahaemolyticus]|uniref:phytanoyl-CoA dioxygenase family protein n=1 Tax=Vibrio parahaemolyticus TaxID=670 RepID=UPI00287B3FA4|nr:phytanoyl-CoA dioxygenase family protein [Vibrio parahaemolyticus]ELU8564373.1 phytanoyl-CoA dioxygenase family protein [Vibrio parahaemolyticus]MDS1791556.1 phytanoyl-CoA dioxygenase family protein [Vibrio parahaemolyticus]